MIELCVRSIGDAAFAHLCSSNPSSAKVLAVFNRCFYLSIPGSVICVAEPALGHGPLTLQLSESDFKIAAGWARQQARIALRRGRTAYSLLWADAPQWSARLSISDGGSSAGYSHHWLSRLKTLAPQSTLLCALTQVGGQTADAEAGNHGDSALELATRRYLIQHYRQAQWELAGILSGGRGESVSGFKALIGAGPGLTPTGDDVLAGVLLALHVLGRQTVRDRLWQQIQPQLQHQTHAISLALLDMAAAGNADAAMHSIVHAWSGNNIAECQRSATLLGTMGQSSGWDTLAGFYMVSAAIHSAVIDAGAMPGATPQVLELVNA